MLNSKQTAKRYKVVEPKPLDKNDWLRLITENRELHQRMATPRGRVDWLLGFGHRRGELPENRDPRELACQVALFVFMTGSGRLAPVAFHFVEGLHEELMQPAIRRLSTQVGNGIDAFVDGKGAWDISVSRPLTRSLRRVDTGVAFNWWDSNDVHDDWTEPFLLAAADAVLAEAPNLRRCAGCLRVFVANDPRERFHDKQCATKYRVAQWRARPAEVKKERGKTKMRRKTGDT
jgi:hypothetical protein